MIGITHAYISINGFRIYWYGVIIAFAIALAVIAATKREKLYNLPRDTFIDAVLICLPCGLVGARLYYVLLKPAEFTDLASILDLRGGGLAIYGGLILGFAAAFVFARVRRLSFITLLDAAAPCIALAQGIGRWGNFMNQEAYGVMITSRSLQFFPFAVYIDSAQNWFAATFFYESAWCLIAALLIFLKKDTRKGISLLTYLAMYTAERCIVEGLRTDSLCIGTVRVSQALSAGIIIFICVFLCAKRKKAYTAVPGVLMIAAGILFQLLPLTAAGCIISLLLSLICLRRDKQRV